MRDSHLEKKLREKVSWLYPDEQVSIDISRGVVIGLAIVFIPVGMYAISQMISQYTNSEQIAENEKAYAEIVRLTHVTEDYAGDLYFVSSKDFGSTCPTEKIDWDIAVRALSEYHYAHQDEDIGPAEIQRHFEENCTNDLNIYNSYFAYNSGS